MQDNENQYSELKNKLNTLLLKQDQLRQEMMRLQADLDSISLTKTTLNTEEEPKVVISNTEIIESNVENVSIIPENEVVLNLFDEVKKAHDLKEASSTNLNTNSEFQKNSNKIFPTNKSINSLNIEKLIGENILNKVGIIITVIGVSIGVKYAIDHDLISPVTRIVLSFLMGIGLIAFALKLKTKYEKFSAVLLSGGMAINYFTTFAAYNFFHLIPQVPAFIIMVAFTIFTVIAALHYDTVVIALIGLVGAYAVPLLLSSGEGKVEILLSYIAIINIGILVIAYKKYWRLLYVVAFIITWLLFSMLFFSAKLDGHFALKMVFLSVYFLLFYSTFIVHKLSKYKQFVKQDIIVILSNSFIAYGLGYSAITDENLSNYLGIYTLIHALIHFGVCSIIYKNKLADKNLFYLVAGMVLTFITIAIPVQLEGNWVTLLWTAEAVTLFFIGRKNQIKAYETLSFPLMILAFISQIDDWNNFNSSIIYYTEKLQFIPFINIQFLSSILIAAGFSFLLKIELDEKTKTNLNENSIVLSILKYGLSSVTILLVYNLFKLQIDSWFIQQYNKSVITTTTTDNYKVQYQTGNPEIFQFQNLFNIIYFISFSAILTQINLSKIKNSILSKVTYLSNLIGIILFLINGLLILSDLRDNYLHPLSPKIFFSSSLNLWIRYACYLFLAFGIYAFNKTRQLETTTYKNYIPIDLLLSLIGVWVLSSEWLHWSDIENITWSYKLGLSILWGVCSLILIGIGIKNNSKLIRFGAIALFAVTLIKLFFYDLTDLNTISRTIVFVSLGILLLIISFLYNKYGIKIFTNNNEDDKN